MGLAVLPVGSMPVKPRWPGKLKLGWSRSSLRAAVSPSGCNCLAVSSDVARGPIFSFVAVEAFGATVSVAVPNKGLGGLDFFCLFENMLMFCFDFLELFARHTLGFGLFA